MTAKEKASRGESFRGAKQIFLVSKVSMHLSSIWLWYHRIPFASLSIRGLMTTDIFLITVRSLSFDSLKTLLAPCLHSLLSAICRLVSLAAVATTQLYYHPKYSQLRPYLTSTGWLLDQPADFQQIHIPLPHEETTPPEHA